MNKHTHIKLACYSMSASMALVVNLPPILFLTFRSLYGLSYSLLGLLILINFVSQLTLDLAFSFFSHKFNIPKTVKVMPWLAVGGFLLYALAPVLFPTAPYAGFVLGTVVFSASGGLSEVLLSPVIAALPSDDPERAMSALHSAFAWGVVGVVSFASAFLFLFGAERWQWLVAVMCILPLTPAILLAGAEIPHMETPKKASGAVAFLRKPRLWMYIVAIFCAGALELVMSQWASSYLEQALGIPKMWGDVFGVAMFGLALAMGRTLYAKRGRRLGLMLFLGAIGSAVCYLAAALTTVPIVGLLACAFTGFCVSMMWPGTLVIATNEFASGGVLIFAMMASGGDLGAALVPQLFGIVTDAAMRNDFICRLADSAGMTAEQMSIKLGLLLGFLLSLIAILMFYKIKKSKEV